MENYSIYDDLDFTFYSPPQGIKFIFEYRSRSMDLDFWCDNRFVRIGSYLAAITRKIFNDFKTRPY